MYCFVGLLWSWFLGPKSSTIYIVLIASLLRTFLASQSVIVKRELIATRMIKFQHNCKHIQWAKGLRPSKIHEPSGFILYIGLFFVTFLSLYKYVTFYKFHFMDVKTMNLIKKITFLLVKLTECVNRTRSNYY